jgi:G3E family GTPase
MDKHGTYSDSPSARVPVSIITGFLGSGKTTLLNHLVQQPEMGNVAVLINELGEVGLDHLLFETITDEIILLQSGCICCQMRGDFVSALVDLYEKRLTGEIEAFAHVLVETTGIADPAPVIQALLSDRRLIEHYRLGTVVTTIDTVFGKSQLRDYQEAVRQVSLTDKLLFCKADLSDQAERDSLAAIVRQLNPKAPISEVIGGKIAPSDVFSNDSPIQERDTHEITNWLGEAHCHNRTSDRDAAALRTHLDAITSCSISLDGALDWDDFVEWIDDLLFSRSSQILRIKGILNIRGRKGPIVIQAVQHMLYSPVELSNWPGSKHQSVMVFITSGLSQTAIEKSLDQFFAVRSSITPRSVESHA